MLTLTKLYNLNRNHLCQLSSKNVFKKICQPSHTIPNLQNCSEIMKTGLLKLFLDSKMKIYWRLRTVSSFLILFSQKLESTIFNHFIAKERIKWVKSLTLF